MEPLKAKTKAPKAKSDAIGDRTEVIVKVVAAAGSIALLGEQKGGRWHYHLRVEDFSASMLGEKAWKEKSPATESWNNAVKLLNAHHWHLLRPHAVHSKFGDRIYDALISRLMTENSQNLVDMADWRQLCRR